MYKKITATVLALLLMFGTIPTYCLPSASASQEGNAAPYEVSENAPQSSLTIGAEDTYASYYNRNQTIASAESPITLDVPGIIKKSGNETEVSNYLDNPQKAVLLSEGNYAEWKFSLSAAARYAVYIKYASGDGVASRITAELYVNGELPFREASYIELDKLWSNGEIVKDVLGNDVASAPVEHQVWQEILLQDPSKMSALPMELAFKEGENTFRFSVVSDSVAVEFIQLVPIPEVESYANYKESISGRTDHSQQSGIEVIEAQDPLYSSDIQITPINDSSSPYTSPQQAGKTVLNAIGGTKWQNVGQKISWQINVKNDGYYKIAMRARQRYKQAIYVTRSVLIDGEPLFTEAREQIFNYKNDWYMQTVTAGDEECLFYFEKDRTYTLTMEVDLGPIKESLEKIDQVITNLNNAYLSILMIVGASPDIYRDYEFDRTMPDTLNLLREQSASLKEIIAALEQAAGKGEFTALLHNVVYQLDKMTDKPDLIASMFDDFKTNIGALGTWAADAKSQPLELDCIYIVPKDTPVPVENKNFFTGIWFSVKCFFATFVTDYSMVAQTEESLSYTDKIKVWVVTGRDQAQIIKRMSDRQFTPESKIGVDIELVSAGTLLPSVVAGVGPDVSLMNAQADPMNYAVRNAVYDLKNFEDLDEVLKRFNPNATVPYQFGEHVYALPETFSFPMFFYRTDIFESLGIQVPQTWDELVKLIPFLQQYKMDVGLPSLSSVAAQSAVAQGFYQIMYQRGIPIYNDGGASTNLDSDEALKAFSDYCSLFTVYQAPAVYDFVNRFRVGEMPCAVVDYTAYNTINLYAPEIKGLWDFVPVPGVYNKDGELEHTSVAGSTASMIMSSAENPKQCWEFVKWWLSADVQAQFAVELESVLGPSAKYATANTAAFEKMTWTVSQKNNILKQMEDVKAVPEVPGGYYTQRILDFAFNSVYTAGTNPRDTLMQYIEELNEELARKRAEFGL